MSVVETLVIIVVCLVVQNEASRILAVFPTPSISHQVVFRPLVLELVKRGHEVVTLTTDPIYKKGEGPANLTEIDLHDMSYRIWQKKFLKADVTNGDKANMIHQALTAMNLMNEVFETQVKSPEVQALLHDKSQKFDLLLLEAYFGGALGFSHIFKAPVILISSFGSIRDNVKTVGAASHPTLFPTCGHQKVGNFNTLDKIKAMIIEFAMDKVLSLYARDWHHINQRLFDKDIPTIEELRNNVDMLFLNVHPIWEINRLVPPNVIYMGGIHQHPVQELPQDLKSFLDSSKHGVIYVSFGTNVDPALLPPQKIHALVSTFSKLPYDIIWKWSTDVLPGRTNNIMISKWLPQPDLLRHPKVKLFITQGGLQSTDESITAGVPLIGMPMMGDQWFNVDHYVQQKIGLRVEMDTVSEEELTEAIYTIMNDTSYRDNIIRLRTMLQDQPQTSLERATWWMEYVLRHGGAKHLKAPSANMPWTEYYEIELVLYVLVALTLLTIVICFAAYYTFRLIKKLFKVNTKLKSN